MTTERLRVHAFSDDALGEHDAVGLVEEIRAGRVSRREVVQAAVERTLRLDEQLDAVASDRFDLAVTESGEPHPGYFAGVPTFVKDNSDLAGLPTQHGTRAFVARPAKADGDVARVLGLIGTTPLGKTRLSEYGFSATAEFLEDEPVRNPWLTSHSSGASSAGAAALVAAGAVPIAHANDGGGSIRIPAAVNGLVGLKPTRGRTPSDPMNRQMPVRIVHDGVVTRSVRDSAAFLREAERAYRDLELPPVGDVTGPARHRLRVALAVNPVSGQEVDAETLAATLATAALLEDLGHHVEPVETTAPAHLADDFLLYWSFLALAITRGGRRTFGPDYDRSRNDHLTQGLARNAARHAWRIPGAVARLRLARRLTRTTYADHDLVLSPVLARTTPELGWLSPTQDYDTIVDRLLQWVAFTPVQNVTGEPAISLPAALDARGLPVGVQLSAAPGHDRRLLEVAYELEAARPFRRIQD
ncbi:MAG: nylA 1 [Marmoricola sp.]|nr:nylA 1 [Marmoricola sp.]